MIEFVFNNNVINLLYFNLNNNVDGSVSSIVVVYVN